MVIHQQESQAANPELSEDSAQRRNERVFREPLQQGAWAATL